MSASVWTAAESLSANKSVRHQSYVATANQVDFTITEFSYSVDTDSLYVYVSGVFQRPGSDFVEVSPTRFQLTTPVPAGTIITAVAFVEVEATLSRTVVLTETITATAGQTVIPIGTFEYPLGGNHLKVFVDGLLQYLGEQYVETTSTSITFTSGLAAGAKVLLVTNLFVNEINSREAGDATAITMISSDVILSPAQYGKQQIVISGALTANLNLIFPNISEAWSVINNTTGGFSITAKTAAGAGVKLQPNFVGSVYGDGVNIYCPFAVVNSGVINVKLFGAVGDGVADDTLAINRAAKYVANLGGGIVYYPPGVYKITRSIRLDNFDIETNTYSGTARNNVSHIGSGRDATTIKSSGFYTSIFTSFPEPFIASGSVLPVEVSETSWVATNVVIDGMTLDMDYNVNVDGGATYGANYNTSPRPWPNGYSGNSYYAADNYQYPVYAIRVNGLQIKNCRIKQSWFNGIEIYRCWNVDIHDNIIQNCGDKANYLGYYSAAEFDNSTRRVLFRGNLVTACGTGVMSNGDPLSYAYRAVEDVIITDNIFEDIAHSNAIYAFNWINRWTVANNICRNIPSSGIEFAYVNVGGSSLGGETVAAGRHPQNIKIANNAIHEFNGVNGAGVVGIRGHGHNISITANDVFQESSSVTANTYGIVTSYQSVTPPAGAANVIQVQGNLLSGLFPGSDQTVAVVTAGKNTTVSGNTIRSTGAVAQCAVRIDGDDVNVMNNDIQGVWQYASGKRAIYYASGARPNVYDNRYQPFLDIMTGAGRSGLTGWNVVDFAGFTPTTYDARGNFNSGTNAFVADLPGLYRFQGFARFAGVGSTAAPVGVAVTFERNGSTGFGFCSGYAMGNFDANFSVDIELNGGDSITLKMYCVSTFTQETGTSMNVQFLKQRS